MSPVLSLSSVLSLHLLSSGLHILSSTLHLLSSTLHLLSSTLHLLLSTLLSPTPPCGLVDRTTYNGCITVNGIVEPVPAQRVEVG